MKGLQDSYHDDNWTEKVTLPIKRVSDKWEFLYGGDVPVKEGSLADLTLNTRDITDEAFRKRVTEEALVQILDEGATLWVVLSDRSSPISDKLKHFANGLPPGATRVEAVTLGPPKKKKRNRQQEIPGVAELGGLWLKLKGLERCELHGSTVQLPSDFGEQTAVSLNHAFTLLSERYEKHRLSHTGNVYERFFYEESDKRWYPLDDLRKGVLVGAERKLLSDAWAEVERLLGWRPLPPSPTK